jgi:hypothetical protein
MPTKYAIRITKANFALIQLLHPIVDVQLTEDTDRYFYFDVVGPMTTGEHDIMDKVCLYNEDDVQSGERIVIE